MTESSAHLESETTKSSSSAGTTRDTSLEGHFADKAVLKTVQAFGIEQLNSVQSRAFPKLISGGSLITQCPQDTARTLILAYPALQNPAHVLVVVFPNEDRAKAAADDFQKLGITPHVLLFGESSPTIKVTGDARIAFLGTPKGLLEHMRERTFEPSAVASVSIDGLDEMVGMGVSYELEALLASVREEKSALQIVAAGTKISAELQAFQKKNLSGVEIERFEEGSQDFAVFHGYYELQGDLLSKPHALCDILESEGTPTAIVFCNAPSDVDLVEVVLRKRGIAAAKLVGYVPHLRLAKSLHQVQTGEVSVLVVTDVAAKGIDVENFAVCVNYSIHSDPEVYFHRLGHPSEESKLRKVLSFVAPLDISSFHYLKKMAKFEIVKLDPPARDGLAMARLNRALEEGAKSVGAQDPALLPLVKYILDDPERINLVSILINNTLNVLPGLKAQPRGSDGDDHEDDRRRGGDRDSRGGDRGGRGRQQGNRRGGGGDSYDEGDEGGHRQPRGERNDRGGDRGDRNDRRGGDRRRGRDGGEDREERGERGERGERRPPRNTVTEKIVRAYIGKGAKNGLDNDKFSSLVTDVCGIAPGSVKRISIRDFYSFADFSEDDAATVLDKLKDHDFDGEKLPLVRALTLSSVRELPPGESVEGGGESFGADQGGSNGERDGEQTFEQVEGEA